MFLIEKLPRDNTQAADEPTGTGIMLSRTIAAELALRLASPWTPPFCKKNSTAWSDGNWWREVSECVGGLINVSCIVPYMCKCTCTVGLERMGQWP